MEIESDLKHMHF